MNIFRLLYFRFKSFCYKKTLYFIGLLGAGLFVSCSRFNEPVAMYGVIVPDDGHLNFHGQVLSSDSLKPIPGIKVTLSNEFYDTIHSQTSQSGAYSLMQYAFNEQKFTLKFKDTDSIHHGWFFSKTVDVIINFRDVNNSERQTDVTLDRKP